MNWEDVGFVKASKNREMIYKELMKGEKTPRELQKILKLHFSQVSFILKEMTDRGIVECLNQNSRKGKIYGISQKGRGIDEALKKVGV